MKCLFRKALGSILALLTLLAPVSDASLVNIGGARHFTQSGGGEPGAADLFTATYASDLGNFDTIATGRDVEWTLTRVVGGGPRGLDAYDLHLIPETQEERGWGHAVTIAGLADNVWRYCRWYHRPGASNNYKGNLGAGGPFINKTLIIGVNDRMIMNVDGASIDTPGIGNAGQPRVQITFDGLAEIPFLPADEDPSPWNDGDWIAFQLAFRYGTGTAALKLWVNNDTFASPTLTTPENLNFTESLPGQMAFGGYHNHNLFSDGVFDQRHAGFRCATTFDSNWHGWMIGSYFLFLAIPFRQRRRRPQNEELARAA